MQSTNFGSSNPSTESSSSSSSSSPSALYGPGSRQISEVIPGFLYISDITCASDGILAQAGFTHVISILSGPIPWLGPSSNAPCRVLNVRCDDDPQEDIIQHVELTNRFIGDAWREGNPTNNNSINNTLRSTRPPPPPQQQKTKVLCHCLAGVSRSPTVVAAYLIQAFGMRTDDALTLLRERREVVEPNPGFVHQLFMYEKRIRMGLITSSSSTVSPFSSSSSVATSATGGTTGTAGLVGSTPASPAGLNAPSSVVPSTTCRLSVPRIRIPVARA
ncbi:hypothetical protein FRC17_005257 [Serendipita sp. 399]|nr:hypothetical protein FRC17_005257 [Serendipita sp. 399]